MIMRVCKLPPVEVLRDYFDYDPETGELRWKKRTHANSRNRVGDLAGSAHEKGYRSVRFEGKNWLAHRVCWALHYGEDPYPHIVDHVNGAREDNSIQNLRLVNHSMNALNSKLRVNNTSNFRGVYYMKNRQKWGAAISLGGGKRLYLGTFTCKDDAIQARLKAEAENDIFVREPAPV